MVTMTREDTEALIQEVLEVYPEKARSERAKHLTVNDGQQSTRLPAMSVTVLAQGAATGTATVTWSAPTQRVDGSPIGELAGYRVLYGKSSRDYDYSVELNSTGLNRYVLEGLGSGTWYFAVQAITSDGLTSAPSREVSKTI